MHLPFGHNQPEAILRPDRIGIQKATTVMIFPKTQNFLSSKRELWNDGYLVFGSGEVVPPGRSLEAVLKFFGQLHVATSISGFPQELLIPE
jgi:hypothetical protein